MSGLFKTKEIYKVKSIPIDPMSLPEPTRANEFLGRGMAFYARKKYREAEDDLHKAISLDGNHIDAYYSLGTVLKAGDRYEEAVTAFKQVLSLINLHPELKTAKYDMLRRLTIAHINKISQGDWNLEKEIWHHIE